MTLIPCCTVDDGTTAAVIGEVLGVFVVVRADGKITLANPSSTTQHTKTSDDKLPPPQARVFRRFADTTEKSQLRSILTDLVAKESGSLGIPITISRRAAADVYSSMMQLHFKKWELNPDEEYYWVWLSDEMKSPYDFKFGIRSRKVHQVVYFLLTNRHLKSGLNGDWEVMHHIDGNKSNNHPENLCMMKDSEHERFHQLVPMTALKENQHRLATEFGAVLMGKLWSGVLNEMNRKDQLIMSRVA